jgi:hypothetical protein
MGLFPMAGFSTEAPISSPPRPTVDLSGPSPWTMDSVTAKVARRAQAIDPDIRGWYTFDPKKKLYTYRYRVWNLPGAANAIWTFAVAPAPAPLHVTSPNSHWDHYSGYAERDDALVWSVVETGPTPADWDSVSLWPSPYDLEPGDSATGFSFTTSEPPGTVSYFVQGFYVDVPNIDEVGGSEPFSLFQNSLTGTTVGPRSRRWNPK